MKTLLLFLLCTIPCFAQVRIYPGSTPYTDSTGNTWSPDTGFYSSAGSYVSTHAPTITGALPSSTDQVLYQHPRASANTITVTFPNLAPGTYTLTMKLAEVYYQSAGQRLLSMTVNGTPWLTNFDIFAVTGGLGKATDQSLSITTTGSVVLTIANVTGGRDLRRHQPRSLCPIQCDADVAHCARADWCRHRCYEHCSDYRNSIGRFHIQGLND